MRLLRLAAAAAAPAILVGFAAPGFADDVFNNLDGSVDASAESMSLTVGGGNGTTTLDVSPANGDGKTGCNLTAGTILTLAATSSNPLVAIVTPSTVTFTSCGSKPTLTVTPIGNGTASVALTPLVNTTGGSFNLDAAAFDVKVTGGNTPPTVAVSDVSDGASYDKGSVPTPMCDVTDAEDGPVVSFPADLSAITGPYASDDIGSQTASCSYTDGGGLSDSASAAYDIVDPSEVDISYNLTPATPDGDNGWWTTGVDVDWTVSDTDSPNSLSTTGCGDFSLTADQVATAYTCSADSAGGHSEVTTEDIKIDGSKPTLDVTGGPADGATYYFGLETLPSAPTCTADDATSGLNGDGCIVNGWSDQVGAQTVTATATDNAGNVTTKSVSYNVVECNAETSAIGTVCAPKCNGFLATIEGDSGGPILGTEGDDVIVGTGADDEIDGLGGNDTICGLDGADSISGGGGADVVIGGTGEDTVNAGAGNDLVRGGTDGDTLNGDAGDDVLKGEQGDDLLNGGDDTDTIFGLVGNDILNGHAGDDTLVGASGADEINGGLGDDMINAGVGNDTLNGNEGNDKVTANEGLDVVNGGDGDDTVWGGAHADIVHGGVGADILHGGDGNDELHGEAGNDVLNGNAGADSLFGGEGDDRLIGGPDVDTLDGGDGTNYRLQ